MKRIRMRKDLLWFASLFLGLGVISVQGQLLSPDRAEKDDFYFRQKYQAQEPGFAQYGRTNPPGNNQKPGQKSGGKDDRREHSKSDLVRVQVSRAGNAFGMLGTTKNNLDYDKHTGALVFTHRNNEPTTNPGITGPANRLEQSYSTDGGATWMTREVFQAGNPNSVPYHESNARYPQGMIYNPLGTNAADADDVFGFFYGAGLDGSNPTANSTDSVNWGAVDYGVNHIGSSVMQEDYISSDTANNIHHIIAEAYWVSAESGRSYVALPNEQPLESEPFINYFDEIFVYRGTFSTADSTINYQRSTIPLPLQGSIMDMKISFAPAPMDSVGYMTLLGYEGDTSKFADTVESRYLLVYRTTDYGQNWTGPERVGINNNPAIRGEFVGDTMESYYDKSTPVEVTFSQDSMTLDENGNVSSLALYLAPNYTHDIIVDKNGDLHIGFVVRVRPGPKSLNFWFPQYVFGKLFHLHRPNVDSASATYRTQCLTDIYNTYFAYTPSTTADDIDSSNVYTPVNMSINEDGSIVTTSFADMDPNELGVWDFTLLDPYTISYNVDSAAYSRKLSYLFSANGSPVPHIGQVHYMHASPHFGDESDGVVPYFVSQQKTNIDQPVDLYFYKDYKIRYDSMRYHTPKGDSIVAHRVLDVETASPIKQMTLYPNPTQDKQVNLRIDSKRSGNLNIQITSMMGQLVSEEARQMRSGINQYRLDMGSLSEGIYMVTLSDGEFVETKKLVVR